MATNDYSPKHEAHVSEYLAEVAYELDGADEPWINEDDATQYTYVGSGGAYPYSVEDRGF